MNFRTVLSHIWGHPATNRKNSSRARVPAILYAYAHSSLNTDTWKKSISALKSTDLSETKASFPILVQAVEPKFADFVTSSLDDNLSLTAIELICDISKQDKLLIQYENIYIPNMEFFLKLYLLWLEPDLKLCLNEVSLIAFCTQSTHNR